MGLCKSSYQLDQLLLEEAGILFTPVESDGMLYQNIMKQIEDFILLQRLKPGEKLPSERELTKQYGVSRTVIREAIKALEQKGYLKVRQGKGVFVVPLQQQQVTESIQRMLRQNQTTISHLVEAREMLETEIAGLAAERRTSQQLQELQNIVHQMNQNMKELPTYTLLDQQFHIKLAEASHNPIYLLFLNSIIHMIQKKRTQIFLSEPKHLIKAQQLHVEIFKALEVKDARLAKQVMKQHIEFMRKAIEPIKNVIISLHSSENA